MLNSTSGQGKYSRTAGKGHHPSWPDRTKNHLVHLANSTWLKQAPCGSKCAFGSKCFSTLTENDVRDCAEHIFGHYDVEKPPSVLHSTATERWWDVIYRGRTVDASKEC